MSTEVIHDKHHFMTIEVIHTYFAIISSVCDVFDIDRSKRIKCIYRINLPNWKKVTVIDIAAKMSCHS